MRECDVAVCRAERGERVERRYPGIPYPSINHHGVIGDRRTAALVAVDGVMDWLCLPNYDSDTVFASLLDVERGGYWRIGPPIPSTGTQHYLENTPALTTNWQSHEGELELTDLMAWPESDRIARNRDRRVVVRRLRCIRGEKPYTMRLEPRRDFGPTARVRAADGGASITLDEMTLSLWSSAPVTVDHGAVEARGALRTGEEVWMTLALHESSSDWTIEDAYQIFDDVVAYWRGWLRQLDYMGSRNERIRRSALMLHMLGFAPDGSMVAAPTTSLPERIGGPRNYDYRYAWVRDASLSVSGLTLLGDRETATRYMDWLARLGTSTESPLQVAYRIDGTTNLKERQRTDLEGYRGSLPIRLGNRAFAQLQLGSLGYLADCALILLVTGNVWKHEYWTLMERLANFAVAHWREPDSGIWELPMVDQYTSSKVMSWVVLDRAAEIAEQVGHPEAAPAWRSARDEIHADVLRHGWSERKQSFVQRYGADALDASLLLIPVMGFLPAVDTRVRSTVERIEHELSLNGLVYRFDPMNSPIEQPAAMGQFEGAFLPCSFWLATTYALQGRVSDADEVLRRTEGLAGELELFAEEADPRNDEMLGNYPLLFSQVEYIRSVLTLSDAKAGPTSVRTQASLRAHRSAPK